MSTEYALVVIINGKLSAGAGAAAACHATAGLQKKLGEVGIKLADCHTYVKRGLGTSDGMDQMYGTISNLTHLFMTITDSVVARRAVYAHEEPDLRGVVTAIACIVELEDYRRDWPRPAVWPSPEPSHRERYATMLRSLPLF